MKIELVGGPLCGIVRETTLTPRDGEWEESYNDGGNSWDVRYTRSGYLTSQNAHRYHFAGQEMHPAVKF